MTRAPRPATRAGMPETRCPMTEVAVGSGIGNRPSGIGRPPYWTPSSSTSKIRAEFGPMAGGAPRWP
jgi:hypothetical protein